MAISITASESFRLRLLRSEMHRARLASAVYGVLVVLSVLRRAMGGVVFADDRVFGWTIGVLLVAMVYEGVLAWRLGRAAREGRTIARWRLLVSGATGLLVPGLLMLFLHLWSPRGEYAALSAPAVLLFPLAIMLSILCLRPRATLALGLGAALIHWALVADTIRHSHGQLDSHQYPVLASYGVLLVLTGVGGMLVSRAARRYVSEAVEEAEGRERAGLRLAAVEHDLEVARQIQRGLLPSGPPVFGGFDIAGMNRPAEQTGGDYYDWQVLPNGRLLVVMADVTGHGIGPAIVMAVCRAYSRAAAGLESDPAALMARLNSLVLADVSGGRFVTLAMAVLEVSGRVELVSAGHGPTFLYRARDGSVEQFGGDGLPLAVMEGESYGPAREFAMERDDVLVMLTDGVTEWQNGAGKQFGSAGVVEAVKAAAGGSAAEIVGRVDAAVLGFAGGTKQNDDVTVVVVKRG